MAKVPLMPKATAVWLVDNTSLTFEQIAKFCGLHVLEVKGIADGDVAQGIKGLDPISSGQLTREELARGQADPNYELKLAESEVTLPEIKTKRGPRYTPVSRRQDRPNAILWLLRHHPELKDSQIMRLVGTTKPTIQAIRDRTHWNSANLQPMDPVTLGLCQQTELDREVQRAARRVEREQKKLMKEAEKEGTLLPTEETTGALATDTDPVLMTPDTGMSEMEAEAAAAKAQAEKWAEEARQAGETSADDEMSVMAAKMAEALGQTGEKGGEDSETED